MGSSKTRFGGLAVEVLRELLSGNTAVGTVDWMGLAASSRAKIEPQRSIRIVSNGIEGDHHCRPGKRSKRQVTLIQAEHLPVVSAILKRSEIDPSLLRRNLVVSGINLACLKYQLFRIGTAVLRGSGNCPPCSRMEENLGPGGYAAMLNHGGITAIVEEEGLVTVGDSVFAIHESEPS
jgi:MOSC domain-containing protein YiiM